MIGFLFSMVWLLGVALATRKLQRPQGQVQDILVPQSFKFDVTIDDNFDFSSTSVKYGDDETEVTESQVDDANNDVVL